MAGTNTPNSTGRTTAASKRAAAAAAATNTNSNGRPRRAAGVASPYASTSTSAAAGSSSSPSKGKGKDKAASTSTSTSTTKGKSTSSKGKKAPPATVAREKQGDRAETQTQAGSLKDDAKPPLEAGSAEQTRCVPPFLPPRQQLHFVILSWDRPPGEASSAAYCTD